MKVKDALAKCQQTIKSHPKQVAVVVVAAIVVAAFICMLCLRGCDSNNAASENPAGTASQRHAEVSSSAPAIEEDPAVTEIEQNNSQNEDQSANTASDQSATENGFVGSNSQDDGQPAGITPAQTSESAPSSDGDSTPSGKNESAPAAPSKKWVVDYTQVWIQDSEAWDESIPTYGYEEKSICNVCGADISGNEVAHGKAHMVAGEGSGHHTEIIQVITGSQTVHHEATGHYETAESGGHWE